jgi:hypothetical protein
MTLHKALAGSLAASVVIVGLSAWGEEPKPGPSGAAAGVTAPAPEAPVFGRELMTDQEMAEHRARMRAAATPEEREKIRQEHHQQMVERAKQRGITLPETPPGPPPGRGMGKGMGQGMGPGGMGAGRGMGPPPGKGPPPSGAPETPAAP